MYSSEADNFSSVPMRALPRRKKSPRRREGHLRGDAKLSQAGRESPGRSPSKEVFRTRHRTTP